MHVKYNLEINNEVLQDIKIRFTKQIWQLIPLREEGEDWTSKCYKLAEEISGLSELFNKDINFLLVVAILEGLPKAIDFKIYRSCVFDAIDLLHKVVDKWMI